MNKYKIDLVNEDLVSKRALGMDKILISIAKDISCMVGAWEVLKKSED